MATKKKATKKPAAKKKAPAKKKTVAMKAAQKKIEDDAKMAKATELFVKAVNRNPLDRKKKKT